MAEWDDKVVAEKVFNKIGILSGFRKFFMSNAPAHPIFGWLVGWLVCVFQCVSVCPGGYKQLLYTCLSCTIVALF